MTSEERLRMTIDAETLQAVQDLANLYGGTVPGMCCLINALFANFCALLYVIKADHPELVENIIKDSPYNARHIIALIEAKSNKDE